MKHFLCCARITNIFLSWWIGNQTTQNWQIFFVWQMEKKEIFCGILFCSQIVFLMVIYTKKKIFFVLLFEKRWKRTIFITFFGIKQLFFAYSIKHFFHSYKTKYHIKTIEFFFSYHFLYIVKTFLLNYRRYFGMWPFLYGPTNIFFYF